MRYWLMKTEPEEFSIDDLAKRKREPWTGIRNYQARNLLRDRMSVGDPVLIYHSSCAVPGVYGVAEVLGAAYPDPTQFDRRSDYHDAGSRREDPRWLALDIGFVRKLRQPVTLDALKQRAAEFPGLILLQRGNRLSVFELTRAHYDAILAMETSA